MTKQFSGIRCSLFVAVLCGLFALSTLYKDALFERSHALIKDLQQGKAHDGFQIRFMELFSALTEDFAYTLGFVAMSPFLSRERFWYYLISIQFASYVKINLKMIQSEPRPVWAWSDLSNLGCASSFGSPSGHSTRSANLAFLLVLDHFFASQWSRIKYPTLNKMSASTHKLAFGVATVVAMTFWLLSLFDRVFLGKHTLNQVVLGSQLGIWCAFFSHFVLRDSIFSHFTRITYKVGEMTKAQAIKNCLWAFFIVAISMAVVTIVGLTMASTVTLDQKWLINLRDTCGQEYEVNEEGLLVANSSGMYIGSVAEFASIFGYFGLYVGQVIFRYRGSGRLGAEAFTSKWGPLHQLVYACLILCIYQAPVWLSRLYVEDMPTWVEAVFARAIPMFIAGYLITYQLPRLSTRLVNYPVTTAEALSTDEASSDPEKGSAAKSLQINEKLLNRSSSVSDTSFENGSPFASLKTHA